jgi:hypothetical protein
MQRDAQQRDVSSMALLMRRGTAVWMRTVSDAGAAVAAHGTTASSATSGVPRCASSIEQLLVNIVAAMALVHAQEAFA